MTEFDLEILNSTPFDKMLREINARFDQLAFPGMKTFHRQKPIDWDLALFLTSAFDDEEEPRVQEAILNVCLCALQSVDSTLENRTAATILLERLGNWPSINLAIQRNRVQESYRASLPIPLRADSIASEIEHTIRPVRGSSFRGSKFQKQFWDLAKRNEWVSLSAPTSAGKSYVARRWIIDWLGHGNEAVLLYVVPTRALITEVSNSFHSDSTIRQVPIFTLPWDQGIRSDGSKILVMTQERIITLFQRFPELTPTSLIVDEAHKVGDGARGIILEEVIREAARRNPEVRVVFASPLAKNPEVLLTRATANKTKNSLVSRNPNVAQRLYFINQVHGKPRRWTVSRPTGGTCENVGEIEVEDNPGSKNGWLAYLPTEITDPKALNVIYVNTASQAEKVAELLFQKLGENADRVSEEIADLQELIRTTIHKDFALAKLISRGVAFHYGNIPQAVRQGIEDLYRRGRIRHLVCTSTLMEGVNLPCTNIWLLDPRRGKGNPLNEPDFWNLAGRAGRWGQEFAGNIICINTNKWKVSPPLEKKLGEIAFASDANIHRSSDLQSMLSGSAPLETDKDFDETLESLGAQLLNTIATGESPACLEKLGQEDSHELMSFLASAEARVEVPMQIRRAHPTISPLSMQALYDFFKQHEWENLRVRLPSEDGAFKRLVTIIGHCDDYLASNFGTPKHHKKLAILLLGWMKGLPIPLLIKNRYDFEVRRSDKTVDLQRCIRMVLSDIEQFARFQAPKYLSCYQDLLEFAFPSETKAHGRSDLEMMLELGVSDRTQVLLMSLGLSRSTTIQISEHVPSEVSESTDLLSWLLQADLRSLDIPLLCKTEIKELVSRYI